MKALVEEEAQNWKHYWYLSAGGAYYSSSWIVGVSSFQATTSELDQKEVTENHAKEWVTLQFGLGARKDMAVMLGSTGGSGETAGVLVTPFCSQRTREGMLWAQAPLPLAL